MSKQIGRIKMQDSLLEIIKKSEEAIKQSEEAIQRIKEILTNK